MTDHGGDAPTTSPPIYQLPEWETITHPPKPRQSLLGRILPSRGDILDEPSSASAPRPTTADLEHAKEESGRASTLPVHTSSTVGDTTSRPKLAFSLRRRLDSVLPPHRTYFGRSRRFLLLCVLLPLAIFLFVLTPLAIGLGVGLSRRSSKTQNLPLPNNKSVFTGDLTYYEPALGACGVQSYSGENIVSVSHTIFDAASQGSDPNANPLCGMKIRVTRNFVEAGIGNRSVDVTVVDRCVGCAATDLDLSPAVFEQLAPLGAGRVVGSWAWVS
ncbi:RlpA-like double-psi beta-barrel-protein domain-containing protein-containing protein [Daldinia caldariorum]|uniref:RlpA-like double-psi beta-barrel-protein domain-containing protein-containing protein n=1 Tax=Daldinia caldariorum TaxID=326644 RepID=UPI002007D350|nr:RlpA-like double-psi beta-barrel-protein domain-containing protein-containing protein [Daldinia caldariorum]KAI1471807.1 RlpA-like double-psi beta-barrel-protein domain-containing protein-containing protein [Daldinia caldariorum]